MAHNCDKCAKNDVCAHRTVAEKFEDQIRYHSGKPDILNAYVVCKKFVMKYSRGVPAKKLPE